MLVLQLLGAAAGLALLARSSDHFVGGAAVLSARFGVPSIVIGAVVLGLGTSAPELLVSGLAAISGNADVGVGNIVGSNIANLTLVLGVASVVAPVAVSSSALRREAPAMAAAMALFAVLVQGGLTRYEGAVLAAALALALLGLAMVTRAGRGEMLSEDVEEYLAPAGPSTIRRELVRTLGGLAGTLAGAQLLVWGALAVADVTGLSGGFVGLTLVAVGTSLPEMVTAFQAARRGESDLIVGNVLGSNIVNSLGVGGLVGLAAPSADVDPNVLGPGVVVMMASSVTALILMRRQATLTRGEGLALLLAWAVVMPLLA